MSKKSSEKLSDAEALEKIARYEKNEIIFLKVCVYSFIIGIPALIIGMIVESGVVAGIGSVLFVGGFVCVYLKGKMRSNAESLVTNQLQDFYNTELQRAFGPCQHNKDMDINKTLIKKLRPVAESWNECNEWRYYEGCYQETRFSVENVELSEVTKDGDGGDNRSPRFTGAVLRCKDVCDPALNIALWRNGTDSNSDLTDPAVFRQCFSAHTADGQPADDLVTPQLRELIRKIVSFSGKYTVNSLIFRSGEVVMAIGGYSFGHGLPSGSESLTDFDMIRRRFTDSLYPVCKLIEGLQDSGGDV